MSDSTLSTTNLSPVEMANIHLEVGGQDHLVEAPLPPGAQKVTAILPAARAVTGKIIELAVLAAEKEGRSVSCRAGCGACCRQLVVISLAEAQMLAEVVAAMPAERQAAVRSRFAAALGRLEAAGLLDRSEPIGSRHFVIPLPTADGPIPLPLPVRYWREQIACPFLEDESCSIHPDRPLVCREYLVTSPAEDCQRLFQGPIELIEIPVHVTSAMVTVANRLSGAPREAIPLVLALEWADAHPRALDKTADGLKLLTTLLEAIQEDHSQP